jgi:hypothetical protein
LNGYKKVVLGTQAFRLHGMTERYFIVADETSVFLKKQFVTVQSLVLGKQREAIPSSEGYLNLRVKSIEYFN